MTVTQAHAPAEGRAEQGRGGHHTGPPHLWAEESYPWLPNSQGDSGGKAYRRGERAGLAVAPGLGSRQGIQRSEPQPPSCQCDFYLWKQGFFLSTKGFSEKVFSTNGGTTEMFMEHVGVSQT